MPAVVGSSITVTLNGRVNAAGLETTAWFEWGTTTNYGNVTTTTNLGSGTDPVGLSFDLTGLTPGITYHYRVVAITSTSTNYGADAAFTTLSGIPTVTTLPATVTSATTATLNGQEKPNGLTATAWFEWGATTNYGNSTTTTHLGTGSNVVSLNLTVAGLSPGATYHYRTVVTNSSIAKYGADALSPRSNTWGGRSATQGL